MPSHANKQASVVTPVCWPPRLRVSHELVKILLEGINVELFEFFAVIEATSIWIGLCVELAKNVQV
jgi:hypothetical protein